ncbi:MAG: energy-coupling factor transport system ATP-binding protein [Chloroflexota bacterium]|nr:energy-coupling factor transport system ATP-binding protein [Chloroflexota bacterium]
MPAPFHTRADLAVAQLTHLTYRYPGADEPALRDVCLEVNEGLTVVTGPSGGGKSTLLRVFNGLVPHFHGGGISGSASVNGLDIIATNTRDLARLVGFVFQDPELQTVYNVVDREVAFGLENLAVPPNQMAGRVEEALSAAGALHLLGRTVRTLSGGERQRVALASALAMSPELVVLDEPTSQLDPQGAASFLSALMALVARGTHAVVSEHRLEPILDRARAVLLIERGVVVEVDPRSWVQERGARPIPRQSAIGAEAWSLENVSAGFAGRVVIDGVDLSGHAGEVVALSGPNGGGKTTLLRLIAGTLAPLSGAVGRRPGRIAYLPQNPAALLHRPTVRSEVTFTIARAGETERPEVILEELGLGSVADRYPRDLSSGERQRAALAAVLPGAPRLVLLDEPTRGMDAAARARLVSLVARLRDLGAAVVLATHDAELRSALADRIVNVGGGRVLEQSRETVPA